MVTRTCGPWLACLTAGEPKRASDANPPQPSPLKTPLSLGVKLGTKQYGRPVRMDSRCNKGRGRSSGGSRTRASLC